MLWLTDNIDFHKKPMCTSKYFFWLFFMIKCRFFIKPMLYNLLNIGFEKLMLTLRLLTSVVSTSINNRCMMLKVLNNQC